MSFDDRKALLAKADEIVNGNRNASYGDPNQDFARTSRLWGEYLAGVADRQMHEMGMTEPFDREDVLELIRYLIDPHDVAMMMILLKVSRSCVSPGKGDHWVDLAGYAACGYDTLASTDQITTRAEDVK